MSEDLIRREDAIKTLRKLGHELVVIDKACSLGIAIEFIDAVRTVPSADRPQGEWLDYNGKPTTANYSGTCSVCGTWSEYLLNYCPYCGARMKGADDE